MFKKKAKACADDGEAEDNGYPLPWPKSERWNPRYEVPRNSLADDELLPGPSFVHVRSTRDLDTKTGGARAAAAAEAQEPVSVEEFSSLSHWLEALAELYMNQLDNRARWDPRWLNITSRERFEGLTSVTVTVVDYLADDDKEEVRRSEPISTKNDLAAALQTRPEDSEVRIIMVSDLSRFVMGGLGQLYSVDPEFWFDHLIDSGYSASDSGLKLKNAVWMNWAERETRFRHRVLPGIGRRTEWNLPRRARERSWVHLRWARLGLLNYLGRKGFHEDEMEDRLADARWTVERDVLLDKNGLLMTKSRVAREEARRKKRAEKKGSHRSPPASTEQTRTRAKTTNIYRAYSSFESLPRNPAYWANRDLRVMAPEGASCWSGVDDAGRKTVIMLFDPVRKMMRQPDKETTLSLTFMPRAAEIETYTEEELWRTPDASETYLDPPPAPLTKKELRAKKRRIKKQYLKEKTEALRRKVQGDAEGGQKLESADPDWDSISTYSSDTDYEDGYQTTLRAAYENPHPYTRHRDFARKYALSTHELVFRCMSSLSTSQMRTEGGSLALFAVLARLALDDFWQLLAEMNLTLDHVDADLAADLNVHILENRGITTRQNVCWMRSSLHDIRAWASQLAAAAATTTTTKTTTTTDHTHRPGDQPEKEEEELAAEVAALIDNVDMLQKRTSQTLGLLLEATALAQSSLVIDQTSGINKLTELAFLFVPLSFVTSIFSMQVLELTADPPPLWAWGVSILAVAVVTYFVRFTMRSPSVRVWSMHLRVTMLNRFTSSRPRSAARRLNSVGNRAIAKFLFFFVTVVVAAVAIVFVTAFLYLLLVGGLWLGAAAVALYFIVTRWPDPAALVPGFVSLVLAAAGMWACWFFDDEIEDFFLRWQNAAAAWLKRIFPQSWTLDRVDDEDLAKEGVDTYTRQAIIMTTT